MKGILFVTAIAVITLTSPSALANLILVGPEVVGGAGFGALPRALTVQSHTPSQNTESGCIAPDGGGGLIQGSGACARLDGDIGGDEAPPIDFPKQSAPTLSSLGITNANQIAILFDGVQPQSANNPIVTINDLTLKLYSGATLVLTHRAPFPIWRPILATVQPIICSCSTAPRQQSSTLLSRAILTIESHSIRPSASLVRARVRTVTFLPTLAISRAYPSNPSLNR